MSDLQDLIARNAVMAYNEGFERGAAEERERIIRLLSELASESHKLTLFKPNKSEDLNRQKLAAVCYHLIALIKGEQK